MFAMHRRGIPFREVEDVVARPEQSWELRPGRWVLQSRTRSAARGPTLTRVFIDLDRDPAEVVTVYRSSRVAKYWRTEP